MPVNVRYELSRCDQPDPNRPDICCDYHAGHRPLDAWPALNNPDKSRITYAHGNSAARHWWPEGGVMIETPMGIDEIAGLYSDQVEAHPMPVDLEQACEVMHDAYEQAAAQVGWDTQAASRKPWAEVPEANKKTMRAAVSALLDWLERG